MSMFIKSHYNELARFMRMTCPGKDSPQCRAQWERMLYMLIKGLKNDNPLFNEDTFKHELQYGGDKPCLI